MSSVSFCDFTAFNYLPTASDSASLFKATDTVTVTVPATITTTDTMICREYIESPLNVCVCIFESPTVAIFYSITKDKLQLVANFVAHIGHASLPAVVCVCDCASV